MADKTIVQQNMADWPSMTDRDACEMESVGVSPWGDAWPEGVWCWDEPADQCLVGTCPEDAEILTYDEARERLAA